LIRSCSNRAPSGIRNRALPVILYRGGLRLSEALSLAPKDVDRRGGTVTVLRGRGERRRVVGLDPGATAVLERWIETRARFEKVTRRSPLFCTLQGGALSPQYVRALMPRLAKRAGIEKRCNPHTLRHTHSAELARERLPMNLIQAQLGHTNLATTSRYLAHIAPAELVEAIQTREWNL
jgi:integrase/recombinase XerD